MTEVLSYYIGYSWCRINLKLSVAFPDEKFDGGEIFLINLGIFLELVPNNEVNDETFLSLGNIYLA